MIERVLLVAWKGSPAASWLPALQSGGFTVLLENRTGARAWRTAKERGIDCVIIDGLKMVSHGRQTGSALRDTAKTRDIPIIWTNLHEDDAAVVQAEVRPDVLLPVPTDADSALAALMALAAEHDAAEASRPTTSTTERQAPRTATALSDSIAGEPAGAARPAAPRRKRKSVGARKPGGAKSRAAPLPGPMAGKSGQGEDRRGSSDTASRACSRTTVRVRASLPAKRER